MGPARRGDNEGGEQMWDEERGKKSRKSKSKSVEVTEFVVIDRVGHRGDRVHGEDRGGERTQGDGVDDRGNRVHGDRRGGCRGVEVIGAQALEHGLWDGPSTWRV